MKARYVHGWNGDRQCVYGKELSANKNWSWIDPVELFVARKIQKKLMKNKLTRSSYVIYKLVRVKP